MKLPPEALPPGDPSGGVVYLRIVLSPEEASRPYECFITRGFLRRGVVSTSPNPQPGGPGHPFYSGSSPLTCLAWETLPVASYCQHSSQGLMTSQAPPLRQSSDAFGGNLPIYAAQNPRRERFSFTPLRKPAITHNHYVPKQQWPRGPHNWGRTVFSGRCGPIYIYIYIMRWVSIAFVWNFRVSSSLHLNKILWIKLTLLSRM